jgi:hypothetical protein
MADEQQITISPAASPAAPQAPLKAHRGGAVLALGILGLVVCFILGVIAWVMGNNDLREMDVGVMDPVGRSMTQAGKVCGIVSVVFALVPLCIGLLALVAAIIAAIGVSWAKVRRRLGWPVWALLVVCAWLSLGGAAVWLSNHLEQPLSLCLFKRITGLPCPTCGFTRGALCVLHGELGRAWLYNPLLFSALGMLLAACLGRLLFGRSVKVHLTRTERYVAWILGIALFVCNWAYIISYVG